QAVADLKSELESDDPEAIEQKVNALAQVSMKLGEVMYAASQAEGEGAAEAGAKDDVVDADFEEVDDDKKKSA
ncbi:MAG: molecular chaperone DnaK, partial [Rhizobiales bacterium]|nr:molecular chaperone DnaK [Hyphomicrobiales bacterium]